MKKILIAVFFIWMSNVWAESVTVSVSDKAIVSVDVSTIKRTNNKIKYWATISFKNPLNLKNGEAYRSIKSLEQVDCDAETKDAKYVVFYSGVNGEGDSVYSKEDAAKEEPVIPGTIGESVFTFVCNFKKKR